MRSLRSVWVLLVLVALSPVAAPADEELPLLDAVRPILAQKPDVAEFLWSSFEFDPIGHSVWSSDTNQRLGPYSLYARPKGANGPASFIVVVNTTKEYLDARGRPTEESKAVAVRESFQRHSIVPLDTPPPDLFGAWRSVRLEGSWAQYFREITWCMGRDLSHTMRVDTTEGVRQSEGHFELRDGKLRTGSRESARMATWDFDLQGDELTVRPSMGDSSPGTRWIFRKIEEAGPVFTCWDSGARVARLCISGSAGGSVAGGYVASYSLHEVTPSGRQRKPAHERFYVVSMVPPSAVPRGSSMIRAGERDGCSYDMTETWALEGDREIGFRYEFDGQAQALVIGSGSYKLEDGPIVFVRLDEQGRPAAVGQSSMDLAEVPAFVPQEVRDGLRTYMDCETEEP